MDIDRFITTNQASWTRLEQLTAMAGSARLGPAEVDELVQLYQRASTHLSHARTQRADPALVARLTRLVANARGVLYGTRSRSLAGFARFFTTSFPAAVWHARRFVVVSALLLFVPGDPHGRVAGALRRRPRGVGAGRAPRGLRGGGLRGVLLLGAGVASSPPQVTVNNIQVGFLAFAVGILLCVPTAVHPGDQRRQPRAGRGPVRGGRAAAEVLRADPPARPARAVRHRRGRRRRARGRAGRSSTRATARAPPRSPSRAAAPR